MCSSNTLYLSGSDGVRLVATSYGPSAQPTVLLLHGAGQTRHSWRHAAKRLAQSGWNAVALDARGHGDSDWPENGDYSVLALIEDIKAVVRQLTNSRKPILVGASLGGITGLLTEGESAQGFFESMVFVDITPRIDRSGVDRIIGFMNQYQGGFESIEEAEAVVAQYQSHRRREVRLNMADKADDDSADVSRKERSNNGQHRGGKSGLKKNLRLAQDGRYYWHWDPRLMQHISTIDESLYQRQREAASNLTLPVLLIRGQQSEIVSRESVDEFLELVPHANFVDIADAAHMVAGDNNDVFVQSVIDFIGTP